MTFLSKVRRAQAVSGVETRSPELCDVGPVQAAHFENGGWREIPFEGDKYGCREPIF